MANPRLNKDRSYGEIKPPTNGAFYEQDGSYFDQFGEYLGDNFDALGRGAVKAAPATPAKQTKAKATPPAPKADEGESTPKRELVPMELDVVKWAKGEEKYGFFSVKAAVKELLPDADVSTAKLTKTALVEAGMVAFEDVKW
jgi:hypothetical protein